MRQYMFILVLIAAVVFIGLGFYTHRTRPNPFEDAIRKSPEYIGLAPILKERGLNLRYWCYNHPGEKDNCWVSVYKGSDDKEAWVASGRDVPEALGQVRVDLLTSKPIQLNDDEETVSGEL